MRDAEDTAEAEDSGSNGELLARWIALAGPAAESYGRELIARYREPHRRYHTTAHLTHVLDVLDVGGLLSSAEGPSAKAVRLAAWFHDAVYDIGDETGSGSTNEERSARLAENVLRAMGSPVALVAEVARLVRCTADHRVNPDDLNAAALCDADLAILGCDPQSYVRYTEQVRDEYRAVPDAQFRSGRAAILRGLLERSAIYRTPRARELFETAARANIAAELGRLELKP